MKYCKVAGNDRYRANLAVDQQKVYLVVRQIRTNGFDLVTKCLPSYSEGVGRTIGT